MLTRVLVIVAIVAFAATLYFGGFLQFVTDEENLRRLLLESGPWGVVIYVLLFSVLEGLGVPGMLFIFVAGIVWPWPVATSVALAGAVGAAMVGFFFARYLARDWIEGKLPAKVRRWDEALAERGFRTVVVLRLIFFVAPWTNWLLGVSKVRFAPFLAGTILGFAPWMAFWTYAGRAGYDWFREQSYQVWLGLGAIVVLFVLIKFLRGRSQGSAEGMAPVAAESAERVVD